MGHLAWDHFWKSWFCLGIRQCYYRKVGRLTRSPPCHSEAFQWRCGNKQTLPGNQLLEVARCTAFTYARVYDQTSSWADADVWAAVAAKCCRVCHWLNIGLLWLLTVAWGHLIVVCIDWMSCIDLYWRFYSHNSSFVHSGMDGAGEEQSVVVGQAVSTRYFLFTFLTFGYYLIECSEPLLLLLLLLV